MVLRGGTHFLTETLHLGPEHAGLKLLAYPGETPTVSATPATYETRERD